MRRIAVAGDLLPVVGTPAFFPSLLSYIRNSSSGALPLDPVIFQAILLCLVAGGKHLLLHTPEEDTGLVAKIATWILSTIFDLATHRLRIKPRLEVTSGFINATDRSSFLRSLFLPLDWDEASHTSGKSKTLSSRNEHSPSFSKKSRPTRCSRSASFPSELSFTTTAPSSQSRDNHVSDPHHPSIASPSPRVADQFGSSTRSPTSVARTPPVLHAHTEPALSHRSRATRPEFPRALVVSGLEHAHILDQRALAQVLSERRVVLEGRARQELSGLKSNTLTGTGRNSRRLDSRSPIDDTDSLENDYDGVWNLPEDFITIYVCPWNTRERPNIHRSLLDKFAMSTTVVVHKSIRRAMRTLQFSSGYSILYPHISSRSHSNPPTPSPFHVLPLPQSQTPPPVTRSPPGHFNHRHRYPNTSAPPTVAEQLCPSAFLQSLRMTCRRSYIAPVLSIYLADLFSAARHHPQLDGTFLTVRAMQDAEELARAGRVLGMDPTGSELVRYQDNMKCSYEEDECVGEDDDQTTRYDDTTNEVGSAKMYPDSDHQARSVLSGPGTHDRQIELEPLYVSEADIARIVPRVITHRLRVRDGARDEVLSSAVFGATFGDDNTGDHRDDESLSRTRSTVKDLLVGILGDV